MTGPWRTNGPRSTGIDESMAGGWSTSIHSKPQTGVWEQRYMVRIFAAMLISLLSGCAHEVQLDRESLDATVAAATNDDEICRSYGAKPGTSSYVECRLNLSTQRARQAIDYGHPSANK